MKIILANLSFILGYQTEGEGTAIMMPLDHFRSILTSLLLSLFWGSVYSSSSSDDICDISFCTCRDDDGQTVTCCIDFCHLFDPFYSFGVYSNVTSLEIYDKNVYLVLENVVLSKHFPRLHEVIFLNIVIHDASIPDSVFEGLSELTTVRFLSNGLWEMPIKALAPVAISLTELEIYDQCNINEIPSKGFSNFSNLITLTLNETGISFVDSESFQGLSSLRVLNLESNMIIFVAEYTLVHTKKLISLKMGHNFLRIIPSAVDNLKSLEILDMNTNNISNIRNFEFLSYMPNIKTLNLRHNDISLVSDTATTYLEKSFVRISGLCDNPYICVEELCSFMNYVISMPNVTQDDHPWGGSQICNFDCFSPVEYFSYEYSFKNAYTDVCSQMFNGSTTQHSVIKHDGKSTDIIGIVLGLLAGCGVIFGIIVFIAFRRLRHQRGGYIFAGLGNFLPNDIQHPDIKFDALVYHHNDEARFVEERLRPRLEEDPNNFRLCLPLLRDFRLGAKRLNNLRESLVSSRCAIFVISHAFVQDARCKQAFEIACDYLHRDDLGPPHLKQTGLILILLDPVLLDRLPEVLRVLVDRLVTLEWDNLAEERCWNRLELNLKNFREIENM